MSAIFTALPGIEVPVGAITKSLGDMWADAASHGRPSPANDDSKATQVNLVLHLGWGTTASDAAVQFQIAVNFSRRYPCRVVVLCPLQADDTSTDQIRAKIYGECHLGKNRGDTRCCEFVLLSYPMSARRFLENQVSTCLSTDLPLYYWVHRFSSSTRLADYQYLLQRSKRVIIDSAIIPEGFKSYPWPRPGAMRDLAFARMLPARQTIGQFLSACPPADLVKNLSAIRLAHAPGYAAEAAALLKWTRERLAACGLSENVPATMSANAGAADGTTVTKADTPAKPDAFALEFEYSDAGHRFCWRGNLAAGSSHIDASLCHGPVQADAPLALLTPEAALGEAMFF